MMEEIRIRPAREEDCPRILELIRELAVYEKMEEQVTADSETLRASVFDRKMAGIFVAQAGENVVGYALYCHNFSTFLGRENLYLEDLYVTPAWRGRGIGLRLIRRVAGKAVQEGCRRLDWVCLDWNRPSREFYEKLGAHAMPWWVGYRAENEALIQLAGDKGEKNNGN